MENMFEFIIFCHLHRRICLPNFHTIESIRRGIGRYRFGSYFLRGKEEALASKNKKKNILKKNIGTVRWKNPMIKNQMAWP